MGTFDGLKAATKDACEELATLLTNVARYGTSRVIRHVILTLFIYLFDIIRTSAVDAVVVSLVYVCIYISYHVRHVRVVLRQDVRCCIQCSYYLKELCGWQLYSVVGVDL